MAKRPLNQSLVLTALFIALAILGVIYALLSPEPQPAEPLSDRSIYNTAPTGYRAWYLTNQKAGVPMRPWQKAFTELDAMPAPATLLMVEPYTVAKTSIIFGQKEAAMLLKWVAQGNTLVLLDDFRRYGSNSIAYTLALEIERDRLQQQQPGQNNNPSFQTLLANPAVRPLSTHVHQRLVSQTGLFFRRNEQSRVPNGKLPSLVLLKTTADQPLLIRMAYHQGVLILGTAVDLGENSYLHHPANDNYQFLANLLVNEKKPIYINEFIHGYTESEDIFAYYQKQTPLGAIFGQLFLAFLVMLWLAFVRWTPKPEETERAAQPQAPDANGMTRYIQSVAGIYYRTQAASLVIEPQLKRLEALFRQRFRLSLLEEAEEANLRDLLGRVFANYSNREGEIAPNPDALLTVLKQAKSIVEKQERLPHKELLKLARQLTIIEERLHHDGTRNGTRIHVSHR